MDIRKIKKLIELLEESGVAEIEIHEGEESVRISRYGQHQVAAAAPVQTIIESAPVAAAPVAKAEAPPVAPPLQHLWQKQRHRLSRHLPKKAIR